MAAGPMRVLVTGSSSGLGRAIARHLAAQGMTVFGTMRDVTADRGLSELGVHVLPLDVRSDASTAAAFAAAGELAGGLDAVIANAGVELRGPVEAVRPEELAWQLQTNVVGAHRVVRAALPCMRTRRHGRIVFISSIVGRAARALLGAYCASKFALEGLAEALHLEMRQFGVQVSLVEPGRFPSELGRKGRDAQEWDSHASPYAELASTLARGLAELEPPGYSPDPLEVARAVHRLLVMDRPPLRLPVGADAEATISLIGPQSFDRYARLFTPGGEQGAVRRQDAFSAEVAALLDSGNLAVLTTLLPGGQPQTHVVWIGHDGTDLLVNTERHRAKYRNMRQDPRVTVTLIDSADPHHFAEIRGRVTGFTHGTAARAHIDELSRKYRGRDYDQDAVRSARVIARITPERIVHVKGRTISTLSADGSTAKGYE